MNNRIMGLRAAVVGSLLFTAIADASIYRVMPSDTNVVAGATTGFSVEVETEAGDNVVDVGYFSFAIDLALTGTGGAMGSDVSNVLINETVFDDLSSISIGLAQGSQYLGIAGVTTDFLPPTFGNNAGDITWLFGFDLIIPLAAEPGDTITIIPSEGTLENLIANTTFDNVFPQRFESATLTVVPEPTSLLLLTLGAGVILGARQRRWPSG